MIKTIAPLSKILSNYIAYFYVFTNPELNTMSYVAFPHTNTCISLFKGVQIARGDLSLTITGGEEVKNEVCVEITGKYTQPFFVSYQGSFEEIAIIFKPLGASYFLQNDLITYAPSFSQALAVPHWHLHTERLFKETTLSKRIERLETFLLENLQKKEDALVKKAVHLLEDVEKDYTIQEVADQCAVSHKTLQRVFKRWLTCSPSAYKRISKFRHTLSKEGLQKEIKKLTEVAYESNYYDQSYFTRDFKKLTGISPKAFFKRVSKLEENEIIWEIR